MFFVWSNPEDQDGYYQAEKGYRWHRSGGWIPGHILMVFQDMVFTYCSEQIGLQYINDSVMHIVLVISWLGLKFSKSMRLCPAIPRKPVTWFLYYIAVMLRYCFATLLTGLSLHQHSLLLQKANSLKDLRNTALPWIRQGIRQAGGAKMTYLDTGVVVKVVDSTIVNYKIQLSAAHFAYLPKSILHLTAV